MFRGLWQAEGDDLAGMGRRAGLLPLASRQLLPSEGEGSQSQSARVWPWGFKRGKVQMSLPSCVILGKSVSTEPPLALSANQGLPYLPSKGPEEKIHEIISLMTGSKIVVLNSFGRA